VRFLSAVAALVALLGAASAEAQKKTDPALDAITRAFAAAFNARDAAKVASFYADDAVMISASEPMVTGRTTIEERYRREFTQGLTKLQLTPLESATSGTQAFEVGTSSVSLDTAAGLMTATGKYAVIYKKVGADWKIAYVIYTND
jgi:uncharacterized protein (TIGR02246 family)